MMVLAALVAVGAMAQKRYVHILATNDMHAAIDVFPQLAALIDSLRAADPALLVFSAGDNRTGNPRNDMYEIPGYPMVALMNQVGFNGSVLGNHDFDANSLPRLVGLSNFRYICANMSAKDSLDALTVPYQVFDAGGVKVGVVGAIQLRPSGIPSTHPDNVRGFSFRPANEVIGSYEWLSRQCDVTILLSHLGYNTDIEMADAFPWLDLIIGGHTHNQLKGNEMKNGVLITQNKSKFESVTYITLTVESGRVVDKRAEYIPIKNYPKRNKLVEEMVNFFSNNDNFRRVVGKAKTPFEQREEIGCMVCDAYLEEVGGDIAMENPGGVRLESHPAGDITMLDVLEINPFDNRPAVFTLTGKELVRMMLSYCHHTVRSFPYIRGLKCKLTLDPKNPAMIKKVQLLTPSGKPASMSRKYRLVTNNYIPATLQMPEDSYTVVNEPTSHILARFLEKHKVVSYQGERCLSIEE